MALDNRTRDRPVDIEIADIDIHLHKINCSGAARIDSAGEAVVGAIGNLNRLLNVARFDHSEHGTEDFFARE